MSRYAVIEENKVTNVIKADADFAADYSEKTGNTLIGIDGVFCDIGFIYDSLTGEFSPAPLEE